MTPEMAAVEKIDEFPLVIFVAHGNYSNIPYWD